MTWLPLAFLMGFLGSVHCAVMCGPIVLALPLTQKSGWYNSLQISLYQFGRILTYTALGFAVGVIGSTFHIFARQEILSFIVGALLVLFTLLQWQGKYLNLQLKMQNKILAPISKMMGKVFKMPLWGFFAGMLNGLIPCGMVYLALATALQSADFSSSAYFMLLFGLGTTPLMLLISWGGIYLKKYMKFNSRKLVPWFALFLGALFILRSANLNIPFFSPQTHTAYGNAVKCG